MTITALICCVCFLIILHSTYWAFVFSNSPHFIRICLYFFSILSVPLFFSIIILWIVLFFSDHLDISYRWFIIFSEIYRLLKQNSPVRRSSKLFRYSFNRLAQLYYWNCSCTHCSDKLHQTNIDVLANCNVVASNLYYFGIV